MLPKNQPHLLTSSEKGTRVAMSIILLAHLKDKKHWTQTITGDESWILFEQNPTGQWVFPEELYPSKVKSRLEAKKCLLLAYFSSSGFHIIDFLDPGTTVTGKYCCSLYIKLSETIKKRPLWLHMDNVPDHKSKLT